MTNYFRITAYHPAKNICAVFDSNGRFETGNSALISFKKASRLSKSAQTINSTTAILTALPQRKTKSSYVPVQRDSPS